LKKITFHRTGIAYTRFGEPSRRLITESCLQPRRSLKVEKVRQGNLRSRAGSFHREAKGRRKKELYLKVSVRGL